MNNTTREINPRERSAASEPQVIGVRKKRWVVCFDNGILDLDLSIYEKMVYIVLCSHAKKDGSCFPSVKKIAAEASCSRAKVFESLKTLEEWGAIVRKSQVFEGRGQTSNLYEILDINPRTQDGRGGDDSPAPSTPETGEFTMRTGGPSTVETGASAIKTGGVHSVETLIKVLEQDHINNTKEQKFPPTPQGGGEGEIGSETSKPQSQSQKHDTEAKSEGRIPMPHFPEASPHMDILAAFNEKLPELPKAEALTSSRTQALKLRINEDPARQSSDWWRQYFERVRLFPWLMGNNPNNWKATFDWLIGEDGMRKVIEGGFTQASRSSQEYSPEELREWQKRFTGEGGIVDAKALLRDWREKTAGKR